MKGWEVGRLGDESMSLLFIPPFPITLPGFSIIGRRSRLLRKLECFLDSGVEFVRTFSPPGKQSTGNENARISTCGKPDNQAEGKIFQSFAAK